MPTTVALLKFVGTTSLGLLTGVSYTLSTQSLPTLLSLPSAAPAAYTLDQTVRLSRTHVHALAGLSSVSLAAAYALSPSRARHPYLLWTALVAALTGGWSRLVERPSVFAAKQSSSSSSGRRGAVDEYDQVNGEQVERATRERQWVEALRMMLSGLGFTMAVVGLWGDGS